METVSKDTVESDPHFRTWEELEDIPAIVSSLHWYERVKQAWSVTDAGFSALEWGLLSLADILQIKRLAGSYIDVVAGDKIADLKETYPILQKRPTKIMKITKHRSVRFVKRRTRSALDNFLGKSLMFLLDTMLWFSMGIAQYLEPKAMTTSEKHVQTSPISTEKSPETAWVDKITEEDQSLLELFRRFLMLPLTFSICFLKETKIFINGSRHSKTSYSGPVRKSTRNVKSKTMSPERLQEIHARRKVSPRKRLPSSSFLGNLKNATFRLFGLSTSHVKQTDIRKFLTCSKHTSLNECSLLTCEQKKRKHPDLSDGSEDDLTNLDLDSYLSEEDPDYEPTDEETTDVSIDSEEEVSEGELEVESSKDGAFKMLKDKNKPSSVSDEKQPSGDKASDTKRTDNNKNEKSVLKPSFEITETKTSVPKTTEKASPVSQTKPMEKGSKPTQKLPDPPVAPLQSQRPPSESSAPSQSQRPLLPASNAPMQQMMSPHGNRNKHNKSSGGSKHISSPNRNVKQHSCKTPENKENLETIVSKELSKQGGKNASVVKETQEQPKPPNSSTKELDVSVKTAKT